VTFDDDARVRVFLQRFYLKWADSSTSSQIITEGAFEAMFCVSFELLDLFNAHMTAVQVCTLFTPTEPSIPTISVVCGSYGVGEAGRSS